MMKHMTARSSLTTTLLLGDIAVRFLDGGVPGVGDVDQFNIVTAHGKWKEPNTD